MIRELFIINLISYRETLIKAFPWHLLDVHMYTIG
jgi:hypothetical protein